MVLEPQSKAEIIEWYERAMRSVEGRRKGISRVFPGAYLSESDYKVYLTMIEAQFLKMKKNFQ